VWWCSTQQTFKARLTVNRKIYDLGRFQDEESAAQAYDRQALQLLRAKAKLNFHPDTGEELRGRQVKPTRKVRLSSHSCTGQARLERDK
jgi:hypothetical protein